MKKLFDRSEQFNENYGTRIVCIDNIQPHPNPEVTRLDITTISGNDIIVERDSLKIGDIVVYCPCESSLNCNFLSMNNQFRDAELNVSKDKNDVGFFEPKGRVKAISLRGVISTGFVFPVDWLKVWHPDVNLDNIEDYVGELFDTFDKEVFSKKYIIKKPVRTEGFGNKVKRNKNLVERFDKLIPDQFSFHYDTVKLTDRLWSIDPEDIIHISVKMHGTSVIIAHVLIKKDLKWVEKILKKFGVNIVSEYYDFLFSSRSVIKNRYINKDVTSGFYNVDLWTEAGNKFKDIIPKGMTLYGEIVGYLPGTNTFIQNKHDYKCNPGEFEVYIYRITQTNVDGEVFEFSAKQVQNWCKNRDIKPVKELYYGKAKDIYPELSLTDHWQENFVAKLANDKERFYMEMKSPDCYNKVPHEGIVIRNDSNGYPALKLKTKAHYLLESKELDSGEADIESIESEKINNEEDGNE
jgi:hypothetical protein